MKLLIGVITILAIIMMMIERHKDENPNDMIYYGFTTIIIILNAFAQKFL